MAKIHRHKDHSTGKELNINLDTGDVASPTPEVWPVSLNNLFVKCCSLVEQIVTGKVNLVDETTVTTIAYSLVEFKDKGKNLFNQVCLFQTQLDQEQLNQIWCDALRKSKKKPGTFIKLCKERGLEVAITDDEVWTYVINEPGRSGRVITDELTEQDIESIREYHHLEYNNCYFFARWVRDSLGNPDKCVLERKSNFVMRILFHITRGKQNKRVIELVNVQNRKVTTDVDTKQLSSLQVFKDLTEGMGNYLFDGQAGDLAKIKSKLMAKERASTQIDVLGWNDRDSFFAFSNGLFSRKFYPVDEYGIVEFNDKHFFIPYHPGTDRYLHLNEKKFFFKEGNTRFDQWSPLYCGAFGDAGRVALLFGIATLFSDHIFKIRGNFPMLFLYGEGGSGKSRVGMYLQYLWGDPQPPLKLSERANTDKGKIRKMAQYVNAMAVFEEFINELDMAIIKTITGIYDRFGYERSNLDSKYGTETVPINSSAFITGNSYPNDDPLMQRLILMDYHANIRDEGVVNSYDRLTLLNREGITSVTAELLQLRPGFEENFERCFKDVFSEFKKEVKGKHSGIPDRMIENYSVILSTYKSLEILDLTFPFSYSDLCNFLLSTILIQAEKRDTGSATQRFWDIVLLMANDGTIKHGKEYRLVDDELYIRWKEIHGAYLERHLRQYRSPGLGSSTLMQKLKDSGSFKEFKNARFSEVGSSPLSCHVFDYKRLQIDLGAILEYARVAERERNQAYWKQREEYIDGENARKQAGQPLHGTTNGTNPLQTAGNHKNSQNPPNFNETDDLPF